MPFETPLMQRLNLTHPIIQAPMAGGGDTPALVAAVCEAGGIGFIGGAYSTPAQIADLSDAVRSRTNRSFGINLFAPFSPPPLPDDPGPALDRVAPYFAELGLAPPEPPAPPEDLFEDQLAVALESGAAVFSFTSGVPPAHAVEAIKQRGMLLLATATTVDEAVALEQAGCEAIVTQGVEAAGHRATFAGPFEAGLIGTMALVPQVVDAVSVPVIASGGIMDGRGVAAALALGADAVQMGTAFLTCDEAGIPDAYKSAVIDAHENDTKLTRAFSGRPSRGIANRFMTEVGATDEILPFPHQNALTKPLRAEAAKQGRAEFLSLWAGQGTRLARRQPAAALVENLADEAEMAVSRLGR